MSDLLKNLRRLFVSLHWWKRNRECYQWWRIYHIIQFNTHYIYKVLVRKVVPIMKPALVERINMVASVKYSN